MTRLAPPRDFADVDANAPGLREALTMAGVIVDRRDVKFNWYSRHSHEAVVVGDNQIIFEQVIADIDQPKPELKLFPLDEKEAAKIGKPSCWAFAPGEDGGPARIITLRYASHALHERSGIDVMSPQFKVELQATADAFVAEGIHELVELNVVRYLFPAPTGMLTTEVTYDGYHLVTFEPVPPEILEGNWRRAACWGKYDGELQVTGFCSGDHP